MRRWIYIALLSLAGCFQAYNEDDDLRTVPITNNPHVVPSHGSGLPMMGGGQQGPY
jgi:hypothetical protein